MLNRHVYLSHHEQTDSHLQRTDLGECLFSTSQLTVLHQKKREEKRLLNDHQLSLQGFPGGSDGKESVCNSETPVLSLGPEDPLEEGMATHSSILAWDSMDGGAWQTTIQVLGNTW